MEPIACMESCRLRPSRMSRKSVALTGSFSPSATWCNLVLDKDMNHGMKASVR